MFQFHRDESLGQRRRDLNGQTGQLQPCKNCSSLAFTLACTCVLGISSSQFHLLQEWSVALEWWHRARCMKQRFRLMCQPNESSMTSFTVLLKMSRRSLGLQMRTYQHVFASLLRNFAVLHACCPRAPSATTTASAAPATLLPLLSCTEVQLIARTWRPW